MSIQGAQELENTRAKLQMLEDRLGEINTEPIADPHTRDLTRRSLKKLVNHSLPALLCVELLESANEDHNLASIRQCLLHQ